MLPQTCLVHAQMAGDHFTENAIISVICSFTTHTVINKRNAGKVSGCTHVIAVDTTGVAKVMTD